jgi:hypothetical protein
LPEYTIQVTGLNVALGSGTYWLSVSPMDSGVGQSFESGTIGANSVGTPAGNDGNAFFNTSGSLQTVPPGNYTPTNLIAGSPTDFSEGLTGVETPVTAETPEPASMTLLAIGACGMAGYAWRRRRQNAAA